jgi:alpha-beta hydrolase superfamily lysophospholipase
VFLASEEDVRFVPPARELYRAAGSADKTLEILKGFDHGTALLQFDVAVKVERLMFDFLDRNLPAG